MPRRASRVSLTLDSHLAEMVFLERKRRGLTYRQAAAEIDISISTLNDIEKNLHDPTWGTVRRLLRWLESSYPKINNDDREGA